MKKKICSLALVLLFTVPTFSQEQKKDSAWNVGAETKFVISQVTLSNWAKGGESSISTNTFFNFQANYKKNNSIWDNKFELAYGLQKQNGEPFRKIDDKIYFSSTYGKRSIKNWYYTIMTTLKTQFTNGYNYPNDSVVISSFFAPAYIYLSFGIEHKPSKNFSLNISPFTGRLIIVADKKLADEGAFGVNPGKHSKFAHGGSIVMNFKKEIIKNVEMKTKLELFSNYKSHPENVDVDWELFFNMKINSFMASTLSTHLIYDDDINIKDDEGKIGPRTQFKELFGLGFTIKF